MPVKAESMKIVFLVLFVTYAGFDLAASHPTVPTVVLRTQHLNEARIQQGATECCPPTLRDCCVESLRRDGPIACSSSGSGKAPDDKRMATCLELHFYNTSVIEEGAPECCSILSQASCREQCFATLAAPSIPGYAKVDFTDHCVPNITALNASLVAVKIELNRTLSASEEQELAEIQRCKEEPIKRDECFPVCLTWMRGKGSGAGSTGSGGGDGDKVEKQFDPYDHCESYRNYIDDNPCIVPLDVADD